ncbi:MAG: Crp/Fnr family transcriptional regulator [Acidobacteriota bacterium]
MIENDVLREAFATLHGLGAVDDAAISDAATDAQAVRLPARSVLFEPGDECRGFGVVLGGSVRVCVLSASGRELVLYRVHRGEACTVTVGCLLGESSYTTRGVVEGDLEGIVLPAPAFRRLVERSAPFSRWVFSLISVRLTDMMQLVSEVAFGRLDQRLATVLRKRGPVLDLTHEALASEVGSSREIVSRVLESLQDQGLVKLARRQVHVLDEEGLGRLASGSM